MVKIIMHGCCGHMGQVISQIVKEDADAQIVAGIDPFDNGKMEYPVYKSLEDCKEEADVVIDFASAKQDFQKNSFRKWQRQQKRLPS